MISEVYIISVPMEALNISSIFLNDNIEVECKKILFTALAVYVSELSAVRRTQPIDIFTYFFSYLPQFLRWAHVFILFLQVVPRMTGPVLEELDRILANKPVRQPMVSTLQQRWAATGGGPPQ